MHQLLTTFAILLAMVSAASAASPHSEMVAYALHCDDVENPLGVDSSAPSLSWKLRSPRQNEIQSAWQVLVASSPELLAKDRGDLWDSSKHLGADQIALNYAGAELRSSQQVFWKVRVWDRDDRPSAWSDISRWTMGVLAAEEWRAQWITDAEMLPWVRREFGYHSAETADEHEEKWIALDLGQSRAIERIRLYPIRQIIEEASGLPRRFVIEVANQADFGDAVVFADYRQKNFPYTNTAHKTTVPTFEAPKAGAHARYVRVRTTQLTGLSGHHFLGLTQIEVTSGGRNVAPEARVTAKDELGQAPWSLKSVVDGLDVRGSNAHENATLLARREFNASKGVKRALMHISGLGHYTLSINGQQVGDAVLSPGWTNYEKTVLYDTHDITALVKTGGNAIGVTLAGGMFNVRSSGRYSKLETAFRPLTLIAQLRIEYADGRVEQIGTDGSWKLAWGPTTFAHMYSGEDRDARLVPAGWDQAKFDDRGWRAAQLGKGPGGVLKGVSHAAPPVTPHERLQPVKVTELRPGVWIYDFGQNVSMIPRLRVRGEAGARVKLIPGERIKDDGSIDRTGSSRGTGEAWWSYILAGRGEVEEWFPQFFYHGARFLQVELAAGVNGQVPSIEKLESVVVHTASKPTGEFETSNELLNRIRTLVLWAQRSNSMSVFTDCPHRERLGWLEQYHLNGPALRYEHDLTQLFHKTFGDMADAQTTEGLVPDIAPEYVIFSDAFRDSPEWGSAVILAAWQHYLWTGDLAPFREHFDVMMRYVGYLRTQLKDGVLQHGLGDWYDIGPKGPGRSQLTPIALTATATYFEDLTKLSAAARLLGRTVEAQSLTEEADRIKVVFNKKFFDAATGVYATGSQCANAMPLVVGLVPDQYRAGVVAAIVRDIETRGLTAGDVGYRYLLRALADAGRSDVVFKLNNQSEKPGYGYQLAQGATSLTEAWDARRTSSQNHFMLGQITEWFYHDLAGIQPDETGAGFAKITIRPAILVGLDFVCATYESARGPIKVSWRREANAQVVVEVTVPANAQANVYLPGMTSAQQVGSGEHRFVVEAAK